jgi:hypothetical protein
MHATSSIKHAMLFVYKSDTIQWASDERERAALAALSRTSAESQEKVRS